MRSLITAGLLAVPFLAQAHGDHLAHPHTHGEILLVVAVALMAISLTWPMIRKFLRR